MAIPTRGITEPSFHHSRRTGRTEHVVPGNKEYLRGDEIPRPNGGDGRGGSQGSPDGSRRGRVRVHLSKEEFLDMFFEDLELPDLVKKSLQGDASPSICSAPATPSPAARPISACAAPCATAWRGASRCGGRSSGSSRRCARRSTTPAPAAPTRRPSRLTRELERLEHRSKIIPYIDPLDVRYNRFERVPRPNTEAVMFCLMDVSGSMTEAMKDLAKRFFMLLHVFLIRRYRHVDVVFIRHT